MIFDAWSKGSGLGFFTFKVSPATKATRLVFKIQHFNNWVNKITWLISYNTPFIII